LSSSPRKLTRRSLLAWGTAAAAAVLPARARGATSLDLVKSIEVASDGAAFAGDDALLTTVSPGGPGGRTTARVSFRLLHPADVRLDVLNRNKPTAVAAAVEGGVAGASPSSQATQQHALGRGLHTLEWTPGPSVQPGTFSLVLTVTGRNAKRARVTFGAATPAHPTALRAPVVRVLGLDAAFTARSYRAGDVATLQIAADAKTLTTQVLHVGPETVPTYADNLVNGIPVGDPIVADWSTHPDAPAPLQIPIGDWPSGVYFVRLTSDDGRLGFAPFVIRPREPQQRVLVVMPTNTWGAYNFYDADGDGFGDTWYVSWAIESIDLLRPNARRGVPFRFRSYDLAFLHWLSHTGKAVDFCAEDDLIGFATGDALRDAYDLVVFPGHTEYVTPTAFSIVQRYRDLGGNLAFLSANNFFRRVDRHGADTLKLVGLWRDLGRPEAALMGNQYRASDRGTHQSPFVVAPAGAASPFFAGTGLAAGATFGRFGIEIDATSPQSPPGTQVLAEIPDALGPGLTAQMTYYEHASGAKVFAAGVMNFGGQMLLWPETAKLVENVWTQLAPAAK
jgi:hypothetical protein